MWSAFHTAARRSLQPGQMKPSGSLRQNLKNPAYAGAFVYGRTRQKPSSRPGGQPIKTPRPPMDWRFVVKDKYPAYIDWATFEKIQAMLRDNRAEYLRNKSRGIPRDGAALLHGITWCGECGHKMVVRYKGGSQYVCNHLRQQHDVPVCQCLRAAPIDAQVAAAFLEAVAPAEIDALSRARKAQLQADEALRHAEERQIQRLRYQATLAERQFNRVDPDNRLVAGELERRWEEALIELRRAEETLARRTNSAPAPSVGIDPRLRAKVVTLGQRLPALWADSTTRREHRKALLRCLIDKVVLRRSARDRAEVRIVWRGGTTTELTVMMPVNALTALPRHVETPTTCGYRCASRRADGGLELPLKLIQSRLGHSTVNMTADVYGHLFPRVSGNALDHRGRVLARRVRSAAPGADPARRPRHLRAACRRSGPGA